MADSPDYDEKGINRRSFLKGTAAVGTAGLAGCGDNQNSEGNTDYEDNETDTNGNTEPELDSVELLLSGDMPDQVDFREQQVLEPGLTPTLQLTYSNGETEQIEVNEEDYEVTEAYSKRTNGEEFYGTQQGPDTYEFTDEMLRKAGFYQELENIDELDSDQLLAGLNEIGFTLQVDEQAIQKYGEQGIDTSTVQTERKITNTVETQKNREETLQDYLPNEQNTVELWREFRSQRALAALRGPADGDGSTEAGFRNLLDLEEEVMTYVDNPEDDQEMLEQISQGWAENAGRATGSIPASVANRLSDIIARNTEMVAFTTSNNKLETVAAYDPEEGNIMHVLTQGSGQAVHNIENMFYFDESSNRNASPILNPESNAEDAQGMLAGMHAIENDEINAMGYVDRDAAVAFMDEIKANSALGENVEEVMEGLETNLRAAVANTMKDDLNKSFEFIQEEDDWTIDMKDASNNINQG